MPPGFADLLGTSPALVGLRRQLQHLVHRYAAAARLPPLLLLGETGTGKSLIARALHEEGPRAAGPFVDVNCAAIPDTLMEAEMFGFERGAFTDARQSKPGLFAAADGGTIFLDEIGLLPESLQAKLLKVVEDRQVRPLGGTASKAIDVWIICATSEDVERAVKKRRFREDLYHRLAVVTLRVPPLRERGDDVVVLAEQLLARACVDYGLAPKTFTRDALAALRAQRWPGNVRELGNVVERVALLSETSSITVETLGHMTVAARPRAGIRDTPPGLPASGVDIAVAAVERDFLLDALASAGGNVTHAAKGLGLTRNTFRYRLRKHGVRPAADAPTASPATRPTPNAARWERRRLVFLRVTLMTAAPGTEHKDRPVLEEVTDKIRGFGGALDGVSPNGVTAVFGLDGAEDAPRRAAHAAMAVRKLGERARAVDPGAPGMKLAIHDEHALLCNTGDGVQIDMNARANIWRTLDRLLDGTDAGSIAVSTATAAALRGAFHVVDGADGACRLLDGERPVAWPSTGAVFVGRRDESAMLSGRLELARAGRGQVIDISGDAGIGKSRLLFEFGRGLDRHAVAYIEARCVSYGRSSPLLPIIELVRRAVQIEDGDSAAMVMTKVSSCLSRLGMPADDASPYLLRLLGIDDGNETIAHLSAQAVHQRTVEILRAIVLAAARLRPLIVAVEDLHWIDRASESYIAALVDALVDAPLLLITTYRPGYRAPWSQRSSVTELRLQPLSRGDARRVLDGAAERDERVAHLPGATADAILDRADGNPFFVEELVHAMRTGAATTTEVPESIEAVLMARIDRLPDDARGVLQAASVLGREVPTRLLEAIASDIAASRTHLHELHGLEYLYDGSGGTQELYRFKHALTQEVAYASLLPEHRRALHGRVVAAIEAQSADRIGEPTEALAHHAVEAQLWPKALVYVRRAGLKMSGSANRDAVACFEHALRILEHLPADQAAVAAVDLRLDLFRVLLPLAEYRRGLDYLAEAAVLAHGRGERRRLGEARASQCLLLRITGSLDEALDAGRQALAIATDTGDIDLATTASFFLGTVHQTRAEFRAAAACYRACLVPIDGELTPERARALHRYAGGTRAWLGWTLGHLGEFEAALAWGREAVRIAELRFDRLAQVTALGYLGIVHIGRGDFADGVPPLEQALALCRAYDLADWLAPVTMHLGFAYAHTGRLVDGLRLQEEGRAHAETIGGLTGHPARLAALAGSYLLAGRRAAAEETAGRGLVIAAEHRQPHGAAACLRVLGLVADDPAAAERYFADARSLAMELEMRPLVAHCHGDLGALYRTVGKDVQAREQLGIAVAMYRDMSMPFWVSRAETELREVTR